MMDEQSTSTVDLSKRVHDMVSEYVYRKTEARSGIKWDEFKDKWVEDTATGKKHRAVSEEYRSAREKVCQEAFLAMRARRSREDFVAYFTGTICAVPQYLPGEDYRSLADALLSSDSQWEEVKALGMLTLSSLSRA